MLSPGASVFHKHMTCLYEDSDSFGPKYDSFPYFNLRKKNSSLKKSFKFNIVSSDKIIVYGIRTNV